MACDNKEKLLQDVEYEGLYNALIHYDDYSAVPDPIFQEMYQRFLKVTNDLKEHLGMSDI